MNSIGACRADERRYGGTWRQCDTRTLTMIEGAIERVSHVVAGMDRIVVAVDSISRAIGSVARTIAVVEAARHAVKTDDSGAPVPLHRSGAIIIEPIHRADSHNWPFMPSEAEILIRRFE
jgi:hypothetical protein